MQRTFSIKQQAGFTLIEIILVIVIMGILSTIGMGMISNSYTTSRMVNINNANTSSARYAMERMTREMRQIAYDMDAKVMMVSSASTKAISFTKSGLIADEYFIFSSQANGSDDLSTLFLTQSSVGSSQILLQHVSAFTLTYYDNNMAFLAPSGLNLGLIRFVQIDMIVHEVDSEPVELHTLVAMRNE